MYVCAPVPLLLKSTIVGLAGNSRVGPFSIISDPRHFEESVKYGTDGRTRMSNERSPVFAVYFVSKEGIYDFGLFAMEIFQFQFQFKIFVICSSFVRHI